MTTMRPPVATTRPKTPRRSRWTITRSAFPEEAELHVTGEDEGEIHDRDLGGGNCAPKQLAGHDRHLVGRAIQTDQGRGPAGVVRAAHPNYVLAGWDSRHTGNEDVELGVNHPGDCVIRRSGAPRRGRRREDASPREADRVSAFDVR